ncbi:WXG100-like domain-containing protein [Auraticoccus cholistanensis]
MVLPGWLEEALQFAGYSWPSTDEDVLRAWAAEWSSLSERATGHADEVDHAVAFVSSTNEGAGVAAFTSYMRGDSNLAALRDFAAATGLLAQVCSVVASIVVTVKLAVIAQLGTLAVAIAGAVASGGLASAAVLVAREVARRLIDAAIGLAVAEILDV